jgi:UDP-N-acetylmuramoyl-tripeptide--D-alanyl-D-alanine ligase
MIEHIYNQFVQSNFKVSTDSRNIIPGSIFFALKGDNFDGNLYAADAIAKGASLAVIDNKRFSTDRTILVQDTLAALQELASLYRTHSAYKVVALTGTNGKTTTKELIRAVLAEKYKCVATKGNLNNHIGVPLTILSTYPETELLIVEMGANHIGEIETLSKIASPDFGLITNIGKAHLEGFGSYEGVIKAKSELYQNLIPREKTIFYNSLDPILTELIGNYKKIIPYGSENSDCYIDSITFKNGQLTASINIEGVNYEIQPNLFGRYNIINILAAIKIGRYFDVNADNCISAINNYSPENNRSQVQKTENNTLILDCYNANPSSMKSALESFAEIQSENKIAILGEMKELGISSFEEHRQLIDTAISCGCIKNIFVGEGFLPFKKELEFHFNNTSELIDYLTKERFKGSLVFIKGSRTNQLEKTVPYL